MLLFFCIKTNDNKKLAVKSKKQKKKAKNKEN